MLSRALPKLLRPALTHGPAFTMNHIKNMNEEHFRVILAETPQTLAKNDRIYKPTHTIEFNRVGEVLLYSANPISKDTVYFRYPQIFYESFIPLAILNYVLNPFDLVWHWNSFFLYFIPFFTVPSRLWYYHDYKFTPQKIWMLRGGRNLRVEAQTLGNTKYVYWIESQFLRPLTENKMNFDDRDNADFLTEEGQLKYDLTVEALEFKLWGVNLNNEQIFMKKHGTIHNPQLFEAAMKGYTVDTSDFVINTADNIRFREGNHDQ